MCKSRILTSCYLSLEKIILPGKAKCMHACPIVSQLLSLSQAPPPPPPPPPPTLTFVLCQRAIPSYTTQIDRRMDSCTLQREPKLIIVCYSVGPDHSQIVYEVTTSWYLGCMGDAPLWVLMVHNACQNPQAGPYTPDTRMVLTGFILS